MIQSYVKEFIVFLNDLKSRQKCIICFKNCEFICFTKGYRNTCSKKCEGKSRRLDSGLTKGRDIFAKIMKTRRNDIDENGLDSFQRAADKAAFTKSISIDEKGLNGFDRAYINGAGRSHYAKYNGYLHYQGQFEKHFLDSLRKFDSLHLVKNGPKINYIRDNRHAVYHSDFIMHQIFEVKCHYTYDNYGKNIKDRIKNNLKWQAAFKQGYKVVLVWDKTFLMELRKSDFDNIEKDLYIKERFIDFNDNNFKKILFRWEN